MAKLIRNPLAERFLLSVQTVKDWTIAHFVIALLRIAKKLPPEKSTDIAERLGFALAPVLPRYRLARKNLKLAFPEKTNQEIKQLAHAVWGNVARTMAEYVFLDQLFDFDINNPDAGRIEVSGIENFIKIRESGKPTIIFTGHTGNWEILPIAAAAYDLNVTALFRPPNNRFLARQVLKARRTEGGHLVPSRAGAAWALANVLEENQSVGLLADQAFSRGPRITFLNREASANPLAAKLARQFDCDIYPARCIRLPGGRFRLELEDKLDIAQTQLGGVDVLETTRRINTRLESWIREYPEQWLWLHDRWKLKTVPKKRWE